jgi:putative ATPase
MPPPSAPHQPLLDLAPDPSPASARPLAERLRPRTLDEVIGQAHLLAPGAPLRAVLESGYLPSLVFWGPPGVGKTTLARLLATLNQAQFITLSAVLAGVKDIRDAIARAEAARPRATLLFIDVREVIEDARRRLAEHGRGTILFLDEVHRFNKAQQDALLPHVEAGTVVLIGATTENPSFELNAALLSRLRVMVLKALTAEDLLPLLQRALTDAERGLGLAADALPAPVLVQIAERADGDARRALILLETVAAGAQAGVTLDGQGLDRLLGRGQRRFDKGGEQFYDQISALHKAVRGSDPDAALYWLLRMLDGGAEPGYLLRRITRMAVEDIGLADPRGLSLSLEAWNAYDRLGTPEGELAIAQAVLYLALAPKSVAAYAAFKQARALVEADGTREVPLHLRNAPTRLMKDLGYGRDYQYDPDHADSLAADQTYWPDGLAPQAFYQPVGRGLEIKLAEKLAALRARRGRA